MADSPLIRAQPPEVTASDLTALAQARLEDAEVLFQQGRYDGSVYLCGYAIEFALKARICIILGWQYYQVGRGYESFKTHELPILLSLSGNAGKVIFASPFWTDWSAALQMWSSQMRYEPVGSISMINASDMVKSTKNLLSVL